MALTKSLPQLFRKNQSGAEQLAAPGKSGLVPSEMTFVKHRFKVSSIDPRRWIEQGLS
ncbi:MAG: hypothetical protein R6U64_02835 [Bacteroidales bacterium]